MFASWLVPFGMLIILIGSFLIARNYLAIKGASILVLSGILLIFLSDKEVSTFQCSIKDGCSYKRTGPDTIEQSKATARAEIDSRIDVLNNELEKKFKAINTAITEVKNIGVGAEIKLPKTNIITAPQQTKGTVLVFFKDGQGARAAEIVEALKNNNFSSAAANSNLGEVSQWAQRTDPNFIQIAVSGDNRALGSEIRKIISMIPGDNDNSVSLGWSFRSSQAQVYLF